MKMKAEEFLAQAYRLDQQIQSKVDQLHRIRACASGSGIQYGGVKVQSSGPDSRVEKAVLRIMEEEKLINDEIDRLVEIKHQIREVIDQVKDVTYRLILEKRSILFETWKKIGHDLNLSERWAQIIHREAMKAVQEILESINLDE